MIEDDYCQKVTVENGMTWPDPTVDLRIASALSPLSPANARTLAAELIRAAEEAEGK